MKKTSKLFIAGHRGMVGSACVRKFTQLGYTNLCLKPKKELNLIDQAQVNDFFAKEKPDAVIFAAGRVGGINDNINHPAEFLYQNLLMQGNVVEAAKNNNTSLFINIGSSCVYPRNSRQPLKEEYLLEGIPEPTNEGYALAKIAGLKLCAYYKKQYGFNTISLMPPNLYGPNDSFDLQKSHVLSALVKRFSDAKKNKIQEVVLWGSGSAKREFLHVDDLAEAIVYFMDHPISDDFINVGWGVDISIKDLASKVSAKVGFEGKITWDTSRPDGMPRKCLDTSKMIDYGFKPSITLDQGIDEMISLYYRILGKKD